jgi:hypothetical protein
MDMEDDKLILKSVRPRENSELHLMGVETPAKWKYDSSVGLIIETPGELKAALSKVIKTKTDWSVYGFAIPV